MGANGKDSMREERVLINNEQVIKLSECCIYENCPCGEPFTYIVTQGLLLSVDKPPYNITVVAKSKDGK